METRTLVWSATALAAAILSAAGCGRSAPSPVQSASEKSQSPPKSADSDARVASADSTIAPAEDGVEQAVAKVAVDRVIDPQEPAPLPDGPRAPLPLEEAIDSGSTMPQVHLTEAHAKTCLVQVGDQFPNFELADLKGEKQALGELLGEKLTVVVFWNGKLPTALEELADLRSHVIRQFGDRGVAVIGVNLGDDPQLAAELVKQAGATFTNLSDRDGAALAQVATDRLPRTYLVDASGKIVWFDIEYSRTTRRDLLSAIRFSLKSE